MRCDFREVIAPVTFSFPPFMVCALPWDSHSQRTKRWMSSSTKRAQRPRQVFDGFAFADFCCDHKVCSILERKMQTYSFEEKLTLGNLENIEFFLAAYPKAV